MGKRHARDLMVCSDMSRNNFSCLDLLLHNIFETAKQILVGGFNPFEKNMSQVGSFPQVYRGENIKKNETTT